MRVYQWNSDTSITQILHKKTSQLLVPFETADNNDNLVVLLMIPCLYLLVQSQ